MINDEIYNIERFKSFNKEINLKDYERIEKIGKGQYSTVYKVRNKANNCIYAMKVIEKNPGSQEETQKKQIRREIENLLRCHGTKISGVVFLIGYTETKEQYILIFEYCDTNLELYINKYYQNKKMPINEIKLLFFELNEGFKNLYMKKLIHRDIKINNILLKFRYNDKKDIIPLLADFGISRENSTVNPMTSSISNAFISAPEILEKGNDYSFASDLWSIGVLLYRLAFGKYPFEGSGLIQIYNNINNNYNKLQKSGDKVFDDLIMKLLNKYKERRITYEQYFMHPFFRFNEPKNVLAFNKIYKTNISSYNKRIYFSGYFNGNQLLKDLSKVEFKRITFRILQYNRFNSFRK